MILKCSCKNYLGNKEACQYQDSEYGENQRAHNPTSKDGVWRCCVCKAEHNKGGSDDKKKK